MQSTTKRIWGLWTLFTPTIIINLKHYFQEVLCDCYIHHIQSIDPGVLCPLRFCVLGNIFNIFQYIFKCYPCDILGSWKVTNVEIWQRIRYPLLHLPKHLSTLHKITIEIELKLVDNPRARLLFTSEMVDWQKAKNENWFRKTIECWSPRGRRKRIEERSKARPQSQSCSKSQGERTFFVGLQYLKFQ